MNGDVRINVVAPIRETAKAWLFPMARGGVLWVPKSQGHLVEETRQGKKQLVLIVAGWLDRTNRLSDQLE